MPGVGVLRAYARTYPHRGRRMFGAREADVDDEAVMRSQAYRALLAAADALDDEPIAIAALRDADLPHALDELVLPFVVAVKRAGALDLALNYHVRRDLGLRLESGHAAVPDEPALVAAARLIDALAFYGSAAMVAADVGADDAAATYARFRAYTGDRALAAYVRERSALLARIELVPLAPDAPLAELHRIPARIAFDHFLVPVLAESIGATAARAAALDKLLRDDARGLGAWCADEVGHLAADRIAAHYATLMRVGALDERSIAAVVPARCALDAAGARLLIAYAARHAPRDAAGACAAAHAVLAVAAEPAAIEPLACILAHCATNVAWLGVAAAARAKLDGAVAAATDADPLGSAAHDALTPLLSGAVDALVSPVGKVEVLCRALSCATATRLCARLRRGRHWARCNTLAARSHATPDRVNAALDRIAQSPRGFVARVAADAKLGML